MIPLNGKPRDHVEEFEHLMNKVSLPKYAMIIKYAVIILGILVCFVATEREHYAQAVDYERAPARIGKRAKGADWPHFLGPQRNGKSSETGIRTDWKGGQLPVVWQRKLGRSYGIGSVAAGRYYSFERDGNQESLFCLAAETGELLWRFDQSIEYEDLYGYNNGPRSSPTIDGGRVYTLGVAGRLSCVGAVDGKPIWQHSLHDEYSVVQNFFGASACPVIVGELVIVMVGGSPKEDLQIPPGQLDRVSPNGTAIVAFDKRTGEEKWRAGDDLASYSTPLPIQINDQPFLLAFAREGLLGIDVASGKSVWHFPWRANFLESVNAAVPIVRGDEVLISECYQVGSALLKFDSKNVKLLRRDPVSRREQSMRAHWATPIEIDGYIYGCSGRNEPDSDLRCIEWKTGALQWSDPRRVRTSLLAVDGHLVVLEEFGVLQLIKTDPKQLRVITELDLGVPHPELGLPAMRPPCWAAPVLSHGLLYIRSDDRLICFELIKE